MMRASNLMTVFLFGLLLLDLNMESAHGLKCYQCKSKCVDRRPEETTEKECDVANNEDRCLTITKPDGVDARLCKNKQHEDEHNALNYTCNDFGSAGIKYCYCYTDLCNGPNNSSMVSTTVAGAGGGARTGRNGAEILEYSKYQLLFVTFASAVITSAFWIPHIILTPDT